MRSTFHGLEVARRALLTQQAALYTTGHNVANANTPGYSRQVVNMTAAKPLEGYGLMRSSVPGQMGMGVEFDSVKRIREQFMDDQFRNENKSLGNYSIQQDTLSKLEAIINEPSDNGIRTVMSEFFNAWSDLSKNPENTDGRKIVKEQAMAMTDAFNHTAKQLEDLKSDLTKNIGITMDDFNSTLRTISQLNTEIYRIEGLGDDANDLRDRRDLLTDQLSKIANIDVTELSSGYEIKMGEVLLVQGSEVTTLDEELVNSAYESGDLDNGELFGMVKSRDEFVDSYQKDLDKLVNTIANGEFTVTIPKGSVLPEGTTIDGVTYSGSMRVLSNDLVVKVKGLNALHQLGYNSSSGAGSPPFFTNDQGESDNLTAATFQLNSLIQDDPTQIATSMRVAFNSDGTETVISGNNTMAVLFSQVRDASYNFGTDTQPDPNTVDSFFNSIVGQMGVQAREANRQLSNAQILVDQVDAKRQSVSGVSLDEEMSNMIKFQHAYNAAARNMTMIDEMLDRIINGMGVVGR